MRSAVIVSCVLILAVSNAYAAEPTTIHWQDNISDIRKDDKELERPILMYMTAPGCSYCVRMKEETFANQAVVKKVRRQFSTLKVDARKHSDLAKRLKVKLYPTTAIIHPSGTVVDIISGYLGPNDFLKRLDQAEQKLDYQTKLLAGRTSTTVRK